MEATKDETGVPVKLILDFIPESIENCPASETWLILRVKERGGDRFKVNFLLRNVRSTVIRSSVDTTVTEDVFAYGVFGDEIDNMGRMIWQAHTYTQGQSS